MAENKNTILQQTGQEVQEALNKIIALALATAERDGILSHEDKAKLDRLYIDPALIGLATAPTPSENEDNTRIATTAFVQNIKRKMLSELVVVVDELPTASEQTMGRIYLVPNESEDGHNTRDEYITVQSGDPGHYTYSWEKFGTFEIPPHPYLSLERLASYLYRVSFKTLPEENGTDLVPGFCTSFVRDGKLHRNLDWNYSETPSFIVKCKNFEGMAFLGGITDTNIPDKLVGQLPYHICDGRNDYGIMVSTHVLFNDWDYTGSGQKNIPLYMLPYLVLNTLTNLDNIESDLADILDNINVTPEFLASEYLIQVFVTDGTDTYVLAPPTDGGPYVVLNATDNPKLTNFRWVEDPTVIRTSLQRRPTGVERWNAISADTTLEDLRFTLAYESDERLSEFIGIDGTTKDSTDEELRAIYEMARQEYLDRERDGVTWQTCHSVVYSPNGMEELYIQENWNRNYMSVTPKYEDLPDKPQIGGVELVGNKSLDALGIQRKIDQEHMIPYSNISGTPAIPTQMSQLAEDSTHRTVTDTEKNTWNTKYAKPASGIPGTDLAAGVIPTVPELSTDIEADRTSNSKTTTPKAVYNGLEALRTVIAALSAFVFDPVDSLPTASASTMNGHIYLVPNPSDNNYRDMYVTILSGSVYQWSKIGTTQFSIANVPHFGAVLEQNVVIND